MPFPAPHLLITAHGRLPGGEVWTCGLRTVAVTLPEVDMQAYADYAAVCWQLTWRPVEGLGLGDVNSVAVTYEGVTLRQVNTAGATMYQAEGAPLVPTNGLAAVGMPNQLALAMTLITPRAGRSGRGRIYLPILNPSMLNTGVLNAGIQAGLAARMGLLISWLDGSADFGAGGVDEPATLYPVSVQSRTKPGAALPVTQVAIGNVVDTIRGRRNKIKESYLTATVGP